MTYHKAYGIIETLAPLHVGASAGEETGNLNLIFRDQFTQTGIIPGSSIRGRFRADMRGSETANGNSDGSKETPQTRRWYGHEAVSGQPDGGTTEALVKFEYASLVWMPVFCPGQPVVWISCPRLLARYKLVTGLDAAVPPPYTAAKGLPGKNVQGSNKKVLFFNLGFLEIEREADLNPWLPDNVGSDRALLSQHLLVVSDNDIAMLHDMGLYRQSRVKLADDVKKVDGGAFFNVEALPEGSILAFPIALKETGWQPFGDKNQGDKNQQDMYFGGLESVGFGRCRVTLGGDY